MHQNSSAPQHDNMPQLRRTMMGPTPSSFSFPAAPSIPHSFAESANSSMHLPSRMQYFPPPPPPMSISGSASSLGQGLHYQCGPSLTSGLSANKLARPPPNHHAPFTAFGGGAHGVNSFPGSISESEGDEPVYTRKGKWTLEEEEYTGRLVENFNKGLLSIPEGTTLR